MSPLWVGAFNSRLSTRGAISRVPSAPRSSPLLADALVELFAERRKGGESTVSPVVSTLLGRRATSFDEFARRHAAIFRGEQSAAKI
jgi:hypothetical protein